MGQSILTLAIALTAFSGAASAQSSSASNIARQFVVGEAQGLRIIAWIKEEASLADDDWFTLEIDNSGPKLVVIRASLVAAAEYGRNKSDITLPLDIPAGGRVGSFDTFTIPAGRFTTTAPSRYIAGRLGPRYFGTDVTMRLSIRADRANADPIVLSAPDTITFRWSRPTTGQLDALKRQTSALLQRVFAQPEDQAVKLRALLGMDEIRDSVAIDEILAAARKRQATQRFEHEELVVVMFRRWPTEPKVVEFFKEGLRERGPGAVADLSMRAQPPWDDSLLEPIVSLVERTSLEKTTKPWDQRLTLDRALSYLDRTYTKWSHDPAIAPRLSVAVLRLLPTPGPDGIYGWAEMLAMTHDRGMIKVLRPYLDDRTLASPTSSNMPYWTAPWRNSELAAIAICRLLGEPRMFDAWERSKASPGGPYPEWAEWDKKLAALKQRLDAMER